MPIPEMSNRSKR